MWQVLLLCSAVAAFQSYMLLFPLADIGISKATPKITARL